MDTVGIEERATEVEVLKFLTKFDYLEGAANGIALLVIDKGRSSLTTQQAKVFQQFIVEKYFEMECKGRPGCGIIPMCEVVAALTEEDGLCSWCRKMINKDD